MTGSLDAVQRQDLLRQEQVRRQSKIIDRLLEGASYDDILREQVEEAARLQQRLDAVKTVLGDMCCTDPTDDYFIERLKLALGEDSVVSAYAHAEGAERTTP